MLHNNPLYNASGCKDTTAYLALRNLDREENQRAGIRPVHAKVFICSPFAGDTKGNVRKALQYCRFALGQGKLPIAPHCYFPRFMDDDHPAERELGLSFGLRLLNECRELWVFGSYISAGMERELQAAKRRGIPIRQFNENMEEIGI
jgi:hypothetical protein